MRILVRHKISFLPSVGLWLINPSKWPLTRPAAPSFRPRALDAFTTDGQTGRSHSASAGLRAKNTSRRGLCYAPYSEQIPHQDHEPAGDNCRSPYEGRDYYVSDDLVRNVSRKPPNHIHST